MVGKVVSEQWSVVSGQWSAMARSVDHLFPLCAGEMKYSAKVGPFDCAQGRFSVEDASKTLRHGGRTLGNHVFYAALMPWNMG
jgi:hypothetical protein